MTPRDRVLQAIAAHIGEREKAGRAPVHILYGELRAAYPALRLIASGGVSSMEDVRRLKALGLYGAIVGKAYYTGAIDLAEAVEAAK